MATVTRISIAPVKGLGLVHPDAVELTRDGVPENRRFHVIDADGRRYGLIRNGRLVEIRPTYDAQAGYLSLAFPDGTVAEGLVELGEELVTDLYGRPLPGRAVLGPFSAALTRWAGRELRLVQSPPGRAIDRARGHVSVVSEASLAELGRQAGRDDPVDGRRFRMLLQVDGLEPHGEDTWLGRRIRVGEDVLVRLRGAVGRCAITTQNPDSGVPDLDTLRILERYRGLGPRRELDFGVYGEVLEPGHVRVGDVAEPLELSLLDATA